MKAWIKSNYYRFTNYSKHVILGKNVLLNMKCHFEGWNVIENDCEVATCDIGLGTYVCAHSIIKLTKIGRFCSIGRYLQTGLGVHPTEKFVSTHPAFFSTRKQAGFSFAKEDLFRENKYANESQNFIVEIGNDVWIGNNVTILDGVKVGDGAVIATGSVVTNDVEPYAIVAGLPAQIKKYRFTAEEIEKLLAVKWWNWDMEKIRANADLFSDIK